MLEEDRMDDIAELTAQIELEPQNVDLLVKRAELYIHSRQIEKAKEDLLKAEKIEPDHPEIFFQQFNIE